MSEPWRKIAAHVVGAVAGTGRDALLVAGLAGLATGAMSMAAGESVCIDSRADPERIDPARERRGLTAELAVELDELTGRYLARGLDAGLAGRGALAASAGGAGRVRGAARVTVWSGLALALTALVGRMVGAAG